METLDKWAERVYSETDFGRSVATSGAGIVGLVVYMIFSDWVIAAFSAIIIFPIIRLVSTGFHEKVERKNKRQIQREEAEYIFNNLSDEEVRVVEAFVRAGGSVLTWGQMNKEDVSFSSIESLLQREVIWTSMSADGLRETFALDSAVFDVCKKGQEKIAAQF